MKFVILLSMALGFAAYAADRGAIDGTVCNSMVGQNIHNAPGNPQKTVTARKSVESGQGSVRKEEAKR